MAPEALSALLDKRECKPHELVEILLDIQEANGHIPQDAMRLVADRIEIPLIEVFRVASFYKAFTLIPRGKHVITACMGTACHVRGAPRMLDEVKALLSIEPGETTEDGLFTLECVNCLGACALGPLVVIDGEYHHHMTAGKLRDLVGSLRPIAQEVVTHG